MDKSKETCHSIFFYKSTPSLHYKRVYIHKTMSIGVYIIFLSVLATSLDVGRGKTTMDPCLESMKTASLPDLPYPYDALEPAISEEIMRLHHQKHHQTYVTNYNKALDQLRSALANGDHSSVVKLQSQIKFNGGGKDQLRTLLSLHQVLLAC